MNTNNNPLNTGWCFAIVNGRLAEIHFMKNVGIWAHGYVKRDEFSKREQKIMDIDIQKCVFSYRNGFYYDKIRKNRQKVPNMSKFFPELKRVVKF